MTTATTTGRWTQRLYEGRLSRGYQGDYVLSYGNDEHVIIPALWLDGSEFMSNAFDTYANQRVYIFGALAPDTKERLLYPLCIGMGPRPVLHFCHDASGSYWTLGHERARFEVPFIPPENIQ